MFERIRKYDIEVHEMHIGFIKKNSNEFLIVGMNYLLINIIWLRGLGRKDNYAYILDRWGLDSKSSACCICHFHRTT